MDRDRTKPSSQSDHLQFLKNKFISDYEEAVKEFSKFPLRGHFQDILKALQEKTIGPSTPIRLKDCLYDLNYVLAECRMLSEKESERKQERERKSRERRSFFFDGRSVTELWFLHRTARKLIRIKDKLQGLRDDDAAAKSELYYSSLITAYGPEDFQFFDASKIHGFHDQLQEMEALLLETSYEAIGIVGMGGSGKTTLAQMVFQSPRVQEQFDPMVWVELPQNLNLELYYFKARIVHEILRQLNHEKLQNHCDLSELLRELQSHLNGRKYLIVLDNVWNGNEWLFDLDSKLRGSGGVIIVTSRLEEVARGMVGEHNYLHRVRPVLDAEACWAIFMDSIRRKRFIPSVHPILSRIKEEVVERCAGLPCAAKTLAEIISIQIGKEGFWSDPTVGKCFRLRLDINNATLTWKAREKIEAFQGVERIGTDSYSNKIIVVGRCNPMEIARKLRKFWNTELVSVERSV